jgi:4-amino-4-deoxy-L-arabinose transferase-like glycosyltransferase
MTGKETIWQRRPAFTAAMIFLIVLACNLYALGRGPLAYTEGVRVLTGHQMRTGGNWLIPHLYGSVYLTKPPMYYWLIGGIEVLTGQTNEWIWRLPSAMGSAALAVFLWFMARRWFNEPAGLVAGLSYAALLTLWSQNRSAEIDALNNTMAVAAACGILHLGIGEVRYHRLWILGTGLAFACTLLMKGHAGLPVVAGALLGVSLALRQARWITRSGVLFAVLLGLAVFGLWGAAAWRYLAMTGSPMDTSGLQEVAYRLDPANLLKDGLEVLFLPIITLAYAFPVSASLFLVLRKDSMQVMDEPLKTRVKALGLTIIAALVICTAALISNPRYTYMIPPLLCLTTGALAHLWSRGILPRRVRNHAVVILCISAVLMPIIGIGLTARAWKQTQELNLLLSTAALLLIPVALFSLWNIKHGKICRAAWCVVVLCMLLSIIFNENLVRKRYRKSSWQAGQELKETLGSGTLVHAETMVRYHPELFYYADSHVQRVPQGIDNQYLPQHPGWYVLHPWEWQAWAENRTNEVVLKKRLSGPDEPVLCRYTPQD